MDSDEVEIGEATDPEILANKDHSELCVSQDYCLNGGTCYRIPSLGRQYCECPDSFEGNRCQLKRMPDLDYSVNDGIEINWRTLQPVAVVVGGTCVVMIVIFIVFIAIRSCYQRRIVKICRPQTLEIPTTCTKKLIYQNASAQTSLSMLCLLDNTQCNGQMGSKPTTLLRTNRLTACSTTPEEVKTYHPGDSTYKRFDVESGSMSDDLAGDRVNSGRVPLRRCADTLTFERDGSGPSAETGRRAETQKHSGATSAERVQLLNEASAKCTSPNDSNNNMDVFGVNSSRQQMTNPNRTLSNTVQYDYIDSDPEATAV